MMILLDSDTRNGQACSASHLLSSQAELSAKGCGEAKLYSTRARISPSNLVRPGTRSLDQAARPIHHYFRLARLAGPASVGGSDETSQPETERRARRR